MTAEATNRSQQQVSKQAKVQKRRVNEVNSAAAKKAATKGSKDTGVSKASSSTPGTSTASSSKDKPAPSTSKDSSGKPSGTHNEFCKMQECKQFAICKSSLQKKLQRKFEFKSYAGNTHALAVAKEFEDLTEKILSEVLSITKLETLKKFCIDNGISVPEGKLTKIYMYDYIEEAIC